MTFFFSETTVSPKEIINTITATAGLACIFGNHAEAQADLSMAIDGRPNTVLMLGLDCSPNGPVWTNFANFWLIFNRQALGYSGLVFRYHFRGKLEENLATLVTTQTYIYVLRTERATCFDGYIRLTH